MPILFSNTSPQQDEKLIRDFISTRKGESGSFSYFQSKMLFLWGICIDDETWLKVIDFLVDIKVVDRIFEPDLEYLVN